MARPKKDPDIKRKVFTEAASKLFFEKGYDYTSIQDILLEVGGGSALSPSVFYYYFQSKDDLFEAMVQEYMQEHVQNITAILQNPELSYQDRMVKVLEIHRHAILDFKQIDTYFDQDSMRSRYFNYVIDTLGTNALVAPLETLMRDGVAEGVIPETTLLKRAGTKLATQIFLSAILPLTHQGRQEDGQHHSEDYLSLIPTIFFQFFNVPFLPEEDTL
ncbi:MAG: TetR/AcrR family transcriptional regulator [Thermoclostridium sp.]|nr:TetR/AcrR family transcriptional regulator [Thermoclostridium sp.]